MNRNYETPEIKLCILEAEDIVRTSNVNEAPVQYDGTNWGESGDWMNK